MKSFVIVSFLLAIVSLAIAKVEVRDIRESEKYIPIGDKDFKLSTIAHSTRAFIKAFTSHDFSNVIRFVNRHSIFVIHTLLPSAGVFQGKYGFIQMNKHCFDTAHITNLECSSHYVDEARGTSVIDCQYSGAFRHNNAQFENAKVKFFIKWSLGKISVFNVVELNPNKMYHHFQTVAERQFFKLMEALYRCGGCSDVNKYIADDITIDLSNIFPLSLISSEYEGKEDKELSVLVKGRNNALKLADFAEKAYFDFTQSAKVLFSDNSTVVAAQVLFPHRSSHMIADKKTYWKYASIIYSISRFDERGLVKEVSLMLNRPIMPWQLRKADQFLPPNVSLNSLLEPIRKIVTVSPAGPKTLPRTP